MRARKKPIVIEAVQVDFRDGVLSFKERPLWIANSLQTDDDSQYPIYLKKNDKIHFYVYTQEGEMRGKNEDYILCGIHGELYINKKASFEATYTVEPKGWWNKLVWNYLT